MLLSIELKLKIVHEYFSMLFAVFHRGKFVNNLKGVQRKWFRESFHVEKYQIYFNSIRTSFPPLHSSLKSNWLPRFIKKPFDIRRRNYQIAVKILENWGFCLKHSMNSFRLQWFKCRFQCQSFHLTRKTVLLYFAGKYFFTRNRET